LAVHQGYNGIRREVDMRYTRKDKKIIAQQQDLEDWEEDDWGQPYLAGYICRKCRVTFPSLDYLEVDHIIPLSRRGTDRPSNLQLLCPKCNKKKGSTLRIKGRIVKRKASPVKKKGSPAKRRTTTVKRKSSTTKRKPRAVKKKASTVRRKTTAAKRKTGTAKKKRSTTRRKSSTARKRGG
jgi:5-methylcytosine-specific restriction endonuclease McrA